MCLPDPTVLQLASLSHLVVYSVLWRNNNDREPLCFPSIPGAYMSLLILSYLELMFRPQEAVSFA